MQTTEEIVANRYAMGLPHWKPSQRRRLRELMAEGVTIAYWCSDTHGYPANGGTRETHVRARPGLVQTIDGPLKLCGPGALHATLEPHRWAGTRVWVVAMLGKVIEEDGKLGALHREFLGEVLPHEAWSSSVGVRIGRKDLAGANLYDASLSGANLSGADLHGANISSADLRGADISDADLHGADLSAANISDADLRGSNLSDADLRGSNLSDANLRGADLSGANLSCANLSDANLRGADLSGANLSGADLHGANLHGANLGNWERGPGGYARRVKR